VKSDHSINHPVCAVTGASGFIGAEIVKALLNAEINVVELGRRTIHQKPRVKWIQWTLGDPFPESLEGQVDTLIHCAWIVGDSSHQSKQLNVQGSQILIESALKLNVKNVIFISSLSAYANARSQYGHTKFLVENHVKRSNGIIIRPGLVYGEKSGGLFSTLEKMVSKLPIIPVIAHMKEKLYLCRIENLTNLIVLAVNNRLPVQPGSTPITAAHDHPFSMLELLKGMAQEQHKTPLFPKVHWRLVWALLKLAEIFRIKLRTSGDSLLSLAYPNPKLEFQPELKNFFQKWQ
jgi:nucleoside-diphosphate-sugar epimerase